MRAKKVPSLLLAAVLQIVPICRVATVDPAIAPTSFAIVVRCAAAIAALLGSVDAVSGASVPVYVAGVQSLLPFVPGVTTNIVRPVGSPMVLRIVLGGSVGQEPQLDYYNATPLPPGLTVNTNINTNSMGLESTNYYIYGTPTAAGVWYPVTVTAGNLLYAGLASTNIGITITNTSGGSPPTINTHPQSKTVTNGSSASFNVVATGASSYQWTRSGTNLPGATSATFTIASTTTNSAGSYRAVCANSSGSVTSTIATLTVLDPPGIITPPQSHTVSNGETAIFEISTTGIPPPTYQWRLNGSPVESATGSSLTISNAQPSDAGDYSVLLSNSVSTVVSASAHLTVLFAPALSNAQMEQGYGAFDITGPANVKVVILASPDLTGWEPIWTNSTQTGVWRFQDTNSPPSAARFYRGLLQP